MGLLSIFTLGDIPVFGWGVVNQLSVAVRYTLFAVLATGVNLFVQRLTGLLFEGSFAIYIRMASGTAAGVIIKYLLDKRFIFYYTPPSRRHEALKFLIYTSFSVVTTLVFWITELIFHWIFDFPGAEYIGGALGLTIGYTLKYQLDKRFVFTDRTDRRNSTA